MTDKLLMFSHLAEVTQPNLTARGLKKYLRESERKKRVGERKEGRERRRQEEQRREEGRKKRISTLVFNSLWGSASNLGGN